MASSYFDWEQSRVRGVFGKKWEDIELNALFDDLFGTDIYDIDNPGKKGLVDFLDLWCEGEITEKEYRKKVEQFKSRWLNRTPEQRIEFYHWRLQKLCDDIKAEIAGGARTEGGSS